MVFAMHNVFMPRVQDSWDRPQIFYDSDQDKALTEEEKNERLMFTTFEDELDL